MLAVAIILPTFKIYFALVFYEKLSSFQNILYMYLPHNYTTHLCISMAKIYTFC